MSTRFSTRFSTPSITRLNLASAVLGVASITSIASVASAETIIGLTPTNQLLQFNSATPGTTTSVNISGLATGERILGIDQRPLDQRIYGISTSSIIYSINTVTGLATASGPAFTPALASTLIGIDFNPTVDRIRYVDALSNNRRFVPNTGATAGNDPALTYAPVVPALILPPRTTGVAYTNSQLGGVPVGTTRELAIDSNLNALIEVGSLAGGNASFNAGVSTVIGNLNFDTTDAVGFDISGLTGVYYASLTSTTGTSSFYTLNPATGAATLVGAFSTPVADIAVLVPEPTSLMALAGVGIMLMRRRR